MKRKRELFIIIIGVAAVIILSVGIALTIRKPNKENEKSVESNEAYIASNELVQTNAEETKENETKENETEEEQGNLNGDYYSETSELPTLWEEAEADITSEVWGYTVDKSEMRKAKSKIIDHDKILETMYTIDSTMKESRPSILSNELYGYLTYNGIDATEAEYLGYGGMEGTKESGLGYKETFFLQLNNENASIIKCVFYSGMYMLGQHDDWYKWMEENELNVGNQFTKFSLETEYTAEQIRNGEAVQNIPNQTKAAEAESRQAVETEEDQVIMGEDPNFKKAE